MAGKQAKILSNTEVKLLLAYAHRTRKPLRNRTIVLLSAKAGLRAGEISSLRWDMVLDPSGEIGRMIELWNAAAKKGSGRIIPVHPELRKALHALRKTAPASEYVIESERRGRM